MAHSVYSAINVIYVKTQNTRTQGHRPLWTYYNNNVFSGATKHIIEYKKCKKIK